MILLDIKFYVKLFWLIKYTHHDADTSVGSNNKSTREEVIRGFGDSKLDACKNTNEITRQASELSALLQAKIAECCCETQKSLLTRSASIRELDIKQAAQTRELSLSIENNRLRDKCDNQDRHSRSGDIEIAVTNVLRNSNFSRS